MDPVLARPLAPSPTVVFRDGLGERRRVTDPTGKESVDLWYVSSELSAAAIEAGLRDRVSRFAGFHHPSVSHVHSVDRVNAGATLAIISESASGVRLSDLLAAAEKHHIALDISTALCVIRQYLPAIAALYEHDREIAHGALAPERVVISPRAELTVVDYAMGASISQLRYSHQRYWKDLRVALPRSASLPIFDHRVDVLQVGVVALSLILGRRLNDDEYPTKVPELVGSAWANSAAGDLQPLPSGLRSWLSRALQIELRTAFTSVAEAAAEFEHMLSTIGYTAEPVHLERFLGRYEEKAGVMPAASSPAPSLVRPEKPAEPFVAAPRLVPPPPRAEPVVRAEAPRVEPAPRLAAVPRIEAQPHVDVTPRFEPAARVDAAARVEPPTRVVEPAARVAEPATHVPEFEAYPFGTPVAVEKPAKSDTSRFDLTPRTDFSAGFPFTPEAEEMPDMPSPKSRSAGPKRSTVVVAAVALIALTGGGMLAARRFAFAGAGGDTGTLTVTSNPTGAQVLVDRESKGTTPTTVTLSAGTHSVELRGVGEPRTMTVAVTAGAQLSQYIELANGHSTVGRLQVRTEPAGALVTIDALPRGNSPITISNLDPGEHAVVLTSDAGSVTQSVTIEAGVTASLNVPIVPREVSPQSGWISVTSPVDVQLFEGGRLLGSSQTDRIMVAAGKHEIEIVNEPLGFRQLRTLQVAPGKTVPIKIDWPNGTIALNAVPWAEVWIDGNKAGETPIGNLTLPIGPHEVVFRHPDLGDQKHVVTVTASAPARLSVDLRRK
jgi:PEGA domain